MDEPTLDPSPEPTSHAEAIERADPAIIGGLIAGAGAAIGPALGELTAHYLDGRPEPEPPSEVILPPGVEPED
jgi:hypothetical protein